LSAVEQKSQTRQDRIEMLRVELRKAKRLNEELENGLTLEDDGDDRIADMYSLLIDFETEVRLTGEWIGRFFSDRPSLVTEDCVAECQAQEARYRSDPSNHKNYVHAKVAQGILMTVDESLVGDVLKPYPIEKTVTSSSDQATRGDFAGADLYEEEEAEEERLEGERVA
jgi:hypothetical protein